jgi:hypothetical protein
MSLTDSRSGLKPGKFWVYERIIRMPYYGIYEINSGKLEVYRFVDGVYQMLAANERGHYPVAPLGVELGVWQGSYQNQTQLWLRWWDEQGNLLLIGDERAEVERERAETERERAEAERERAERAEQTQRDAIPRLLSMGLSVEQVASALGFSIDIVRQFSQD